jgi:outer membrane protein assembly factor BamB
MWAGTTERNPVSSEKNLIVPSAGGGAVAEPAKDAKGKKAKVAEGTADTAIPGIKWQAKLGGKAVGTPVIAEGRVFIGSSAWVFPGDTRSLSRDGGAVICFDEATGKPLWSLPIPRMSTKANGFNFDHMSFGTCSTPTVDGKRLYIVGNRDDLLCLDVRGQAGGDKSPYDQARYMTPYTLPNKPGRFDSKELVKLPTPLPVLPTDGDILWVFDMVGGVDSWPQDAASSSPLVYGDFVYASTANGVDSSHKNHPSPHAPDLVCVDKKTGRLLGVNENPIGDNVLHGQWSSPTLITIGGRDLVIYGGGDGICYAYDPKPVPSTKAGEPGLLKVVWQCDCCLPGMRGEKYRTGNGPSEIDSTPVFYKNRLYVTIGQDPTHGSGHGCLTCIDPTKTGDITKTGVLWRYTAIDRSISTPAIFNDLLFVADHGGTLHCLDANTGKAYWTRKLNDHACGSALVADGKVYQCDEGGHMTVMVASAQEKCLGTIQFDAPIWSSPVAANGVLYVATQSTLYALKAPAAAATAP